ncbi:MAG TPA: AcvB/VirJ family lysyl-phosphatidylglycerol hydrolase, partial [Candidatus Polarisedimenticolia bacterium]|nr:AcvB/VirJ family lysyl-phosphatidylglycerol hydrolase [Candidatus Polarisedimenticolia bacterium]
MKRSGAVPGWVPVGAWALASILLATPGAAESPAPERAAAEAPVMTPAPAPPAPSGALPPAEPPGFVEELVSVPIFGKVRIYRPDPLRGTRGVVLFVSGDGGWNLGVVDMARRTADRTLVVGIPMPAWRKAAQRGAGHCWFPAGELEEIGQSIEKTYGLPRYLPPILVGYSSGATLVYGALAQAPAESFAGAISLGFCPDLEVGRPLCAHGDWKPDYEPKKKTSLLPPLAEIAPRPEGEARWTALQGRVDKVCDPAVVERFVAQVPAARVVWLPKVGHGFSVSRNWGEAYDEAVTALLDPESAWDPLPEEARHVVPNYSPAEIEARLEALDLPLEVQWPERARTVLIFVSGDGGWAELDQRVAASLADRGVAVVGWNALRYFWEARSPERFLADLRRVLEALPESVRVFAGGYSFGAEVIPAALAAEKAVAGGAGDAPSTAGAPVGPTGAPGPGAAAGMGVAAGASAAGGPGATGGPSAMGGPGVAAETI